MSKITHPLLLSVMISSLTCCSAARSQDRLNTLTEQQGQEFNAYIKNETIRLQFLNKNVDEMEIGEWQRRYFVNVNN